MKKLFFLALAAFALTLTGCSDTNPPSSGEEGTDSKNVREMTIHVLSEDVQKQAPYIRASVDCEDWLIFDVKHDGLTYTDSRSFVFLSKTEQLGYYLYATPTMTIMSQFTDDIDKAFTSGNVMYMADQGDYIRYAVVNSLWENPTILSDKLVEASAEDVNKAPAHTDAYRRDDFGASIYRTISKHFRKGSEEISDSYGWLSWANLPSVNTVVNIWSSYAFAASLHQIYDGNPELEEELQEDIQQDNIHFIKMTLKASNKYIAFAAAEVDLLLNHSIIGKYWYANDMVEEPAEEGDGDYSLPMFSTSRQMDTKRDKVQVVTEQQKDYAIVLTKQTVEETSATFHVSISNLTGTQGFISSMKLVLEPTKGGAAVETDFFFMSGSVTASGLTPLTAYKAKVLMYSMGEPYTSNVVPVVTKGTLHLYPDKISFPAKGGSRGVALQDIDLDLLKSFSVSAPDWCKITQSTSSFFVDVAAYSEKRTGTITVTAILNDDSKLSASLPVTQEDIKLGWNQTQWRITGNVTTSGFGESATNYGDFVLTVNSVEDNSFSWTSGGTEVPGTAQISVNDQNQLCVSKVYTYMGSTGTFTLTLTRIDETTASCVYNGSGTGVSQHGNMNAVLVN